MAFGKRRRDAPSAMPKGWEATAAGLAGGGPRASGKPRAGVKARMQSSYKPGIRDSSGSKTGGGDLVRQMRNDQMRGQDASKFLRKK